MGGSVLCLLLLAAGTSPTETEPRLPGSRLATLENGAPASPPVRDARRERFPRFHHEVPPQLAARAPAARSRPAPAQLLPVPARRAAATVPPAATTHRMETPDAALAARLAPPAAVLAAAIAEAGGSGEGMAGPEVALAVPIPEEARRARDEALANGDIAALVVPLPTLRPENGAAPSSAVAALAPALRPEPPAVPVLAYARPDAGALSVPDIDPVPRRVAPRLERGTAIYDISAATVYLPSGERLEAHSGLGSMRDDVRFVREKMRGPTPPHTYDLTLRESLFHGVQAIRLNPVGGERRIHNRNGLLAHTYMLGPKGDSNGCVSFKDYKRFLAAYQRGEIRRLVVVDKLDAADTPKPSLLARLLRSAG